MLQTVKVVTKATHFRTLESITNLWGSGQEAKIHGCPSPTSGIGKAVLWAPQNIEWEQKNIV